jgi:hypothetical protein
MPLRSGGQAPPQNEAVRLGRGRLLCFLHLPSSGDARISNRRLLPVCLLSTVPPPIAAHVAAHAPTPPPQVLPCSKHYVHDWTACPFAHPHEKARRRDPRKHQYTGIACPSMRQARGAVGCGLARLPLCIRSLLALQPGPAADGLLTAVGQLHEACVPAAHGWLAPH